MKYVSIEECNGCAMTAVYYDGCDTLYLAFGDRYTRIRATNSYDSVDLELHGDEPTVQRDGYDLVRIGLITQAQLEAFKEQQRRQRVLEQEERDRRAYEMLKAKFGE